MAALAEERNDEERIIENMLLDGRTALYEDLDFLPTRQSLYNSEKMIPEYDDEVFQRITYVTDAVLLRSLPLRLATGEIENAVALIHSILPLCTPSLLMKTIRKAN